MRLQRHWKAILFEESNVRKDYTVDMLNIHIISVFAAFKLQGRRLQAI